MKIIVVAKFLFVMFLIMCFSCHIMHDQESLTELDTSYQVNVKNSKVDSLVSANGEAVDDQILNDINSMYLELNKIPDHEDKIAVVESYGNTRSICSISHDQYVYSETAERHYHPWPFVCFKWTKTYKCRNCTLRKDIIGHIR